MTTLILGGGYAGAIAAVRLARRGVPVTLVDARDGLVERIRLHQMAAGDDIPPIPYATIFRGLPVEFVRARATRIDRERRVVETTAGALRYDRLVYALGSGSPSLQVPADARTLAVVGAGLTGIETAAEFAERRPELAVTLYDAGTIGASFSEGAQKHLRRWMAQHDVTLRENERVTSVDADAVLWCTSFSAAPLAAGAGLAVNERGQIVVDDHLRSSDPSIYAIGDAAAFASVRMGCVSAMPMGAYVADLLAGTTRDPFRFAFFIRCVSLGRRDGIVQFTRADDSPRDAFLGGRAAAWIKEMICRLTITSIRLERSGVHYTWAKTAAA